MKLKIPRRQRGFTILELVIGIVVLGVLVAIIIFVARPSDPNSGDLPEDRNAQRQSDVNTIVNAVYQYSLDNNRAVPATITTAPTEICATGARSCTGLVDLSVLSAGGNYLVTQPKDPLCGTASACATNGTGYKIAKTANNHVTVSAPNSEIDEIISITK